MEISTPLEPCTHARSAMLAITTSSGRKLPSKICCNRRINDQARRDRHRGDGDDAQPVARRWPLGQRPEHRGRRVGANSPSVFHFLTPLFTEAAQFYHAKLAQGRGG